MKGEPKSRRHWQLTDSASQCFGNYILHDLYWNPNFLNKQFIPFFSVSNSIPKTNSSESEMDVKKKRNSFNCFQKVELEEIFFYNAYPTRKACQYLADRFGTSTHSVKVNMIKLTAVRGSQDVFISPRDFKLQCIVFQNKNHNSVSAARGQSCLSCFEGFCPGSPPSTTINF